MSHYSESGFPPLLNLGFALSKACSQFAKEMDFALEHKGFNRSHVGVLLLLSGCSARSQAELCRMLGLDSGYVTRVVEWLERQGLVRRSRNIQDGRVVNLTLTKVGQDVAADTAVTVAAVLNRLLSDFTFSEFATLGRLIGKLLDG